MFIEDLSLVDIKNNKNKKNNCVPSFCKCTYWYLKNITILKDLTESIVKPNNNFLIAYS